MSDSPPPRFYYRIELLSAGSGAETVMKSVSVRGYRPTVHRAALKLAEWEGASGYQLRRLRDEKAVDRREFSR